MEGEAFVLISMHSSYLYYGYLYLILKTGGTILTFNVYLAFILQRYKPYNPTCRNASSTRMVDPFI